MLCLAQVLFPETYRSFPGTIRQARQSEDHEEMLYDVEYAEPVNGKFVVDQNVPASRVTLMNEEERKALAQQKKIWAQQELRRGPLGSWVPSSSVSGKKRQQASITLDNVNQHDETASISMSVAPSDVTAPTTMSSNSSRPKRASAAAAKVNMLVGDEMDVILDEAEQAERAEAVEKLRVAGSSSSSRSSSKAKSARGSTKASIVPGGEAMPLAPGEQMTEEDVDVDALESCDAAPLSGLTAKDFIARLLKKIEGASSSAVKSSSSSRMETEDMFLGDMADQEEDEPGCVLTPQEIVQLNEVLTAKQVHLMLQAIHGGGRGSIGNSAKSSKNTKQKEKKQKGRGAAVSPDEAAAEALGLGDNGDAGEALADSSGTRRSGRRSIKPERLDE